MKMLSKTIASLSIAILLVSYAANSTVIVHAASDTEVPALTVPEERGIGFDGETVVEIIDNSTIKLSYVDGTSDLLERKSDGVYKNGQLFISNWDLIDTQSRSASNSWVVVGTTLGRVDRDETVNQLSSYIYGTVLGTVGAGPLGAILGLVSALIPNTPPAPYSMRTVLFNQSTMTFKIVTHYYKNSNFSGYVTTTTKYLKVPV